MKLSADEQTVINRAIIQLRSTIELLEVVKRPDIPEETENAIIGESTSRAIEQLNIIRDEWGFDSVGMYDEGSSDAS